MQKDLEELLNLKIQYIYGDTLYVSGTKGPLWGHEWQQNFKYIATPIVKGLIYNDIDKLQGLGAILAPEFAP